MSTPLKAQNPGIPLPVPTPESAPFWEGCQRGELLFQRCQACGWANFIPVAACRNCLSTELQWEQSSGKGALYSWTIIWRPQTPAFEVPYAVGIVDVDEGYQMLSAIIDVDADELRLGMRLEVDFREMSDEITLPYFRPAAS